MKTLPLEHRLNEAEKEYNNIKHKYDNTVELIKEDLLSGRGKYELRHQTKFEHNIMLHYGVFSKHMHDLDDRLSISTVKTYEGDNLIHQDYCFIKRDDSFLNDGKIVVGVTCNLNDMHLACSNYIRDLWMYSIKRERYDDSLEMFKEKCKEDSKYMFKALQSYMFGTERKFTLTLTDKPELDINNIVMFIDATHYYETRTSW